MEIIIYFTTIKLVLHKYVYLHKDVHIVSLPPIPGIYNYFNKINCLFKIFFTVGNALLEKLHRYSFQFIYKRISHDALAVPLMER